MSSLTSLSLVEAAQSIARREISPVELTCAYLERIVSLDSRLNCFITLTAEQALADAYQAGQALAKGAPLSLLHGIPLALKDLFETRRVRTTAGSTFFSEYIPEADAAVVERLAQAGAVFLGKLNMHEIALGVTNVNPHFGPCHNPWELERVTGGSSGGSAAALAAGLCPGALGTDHRRLDPYPCLAVWCGRAEAHARAGEPARRDPAELEQRSMPARWRGGWRM